MSTSHLRTKCLWTEFLFPNALLVGEKGAYQKRSSVGHDLPGMVHPWVVCSWKCRQNWHLHLSFFSMLNQIVTDFHNLWTKILSQGEGQNTSSPVDANFSISGHWSASSMYAIKASGLLMDQSLTQTSSPEIMGQTSPETSSFSDFSGRVALWNTGQQS